MQYRREPFFEAFKVFPGEAYLVDAAVDVIEANALGRHRLATDGARAHEFLKAVLAGDVPGFQAKRLPAFPTPYLIASGPPALDALLRGAKATSHLTDRQAQVLGHLVHGFANSRIAKALCCAGGTVEAHVSAILSKAGAKRRTDLVVALWSLRVPPIAKDPQSGYPSAQDHGVGASR
jgi:DNA-binding NarL/FixJ family response regulator